MKLTLKPNEKLLLWRRRAELGQSAAARKHRVTLYRYRKWEDGTEIDGIPRPRLGAIREHERFLLARLRAGISVAELARAAGVSRWWLIRMEKGEAPTDRLLDAWNARNARARARGPKRKRRAG